MNAPPKPPGGAGAPPAGTTTRREELADGERLGRPSQSTARCRASLRSAARRRTNAAVERREAPAPGNRRGTKCYGRALRRSPSLGLAPRARERPRASGDGIRRTPRRSRIGAMTHVCCLTIEAERARATNSAHARGSGKSSSCQAALGPAFAGTSGVIRQRCPRGWMSKNLSPGTAGGRAGARRPAGRRRASDARNRAGRPPSRRRRNRSRCCRDRPPASGRFCR